MAHLARSLGRRLRRVRDFVRYLRELRAFAGASRGVGELPPVRWRDRWPVLGEWTAQTAFEPHYTYHPAWAARILAQTRPAEHVDISSSVAFVAVASAFVPIRFYDYRPAPLRLDGLECGAADLLALPFETGSVRSLSCMHVIEHVGLGRYGDPLDPEGDRKALRELARVLAPGGNLLLVVPVGRERVEFNAHRVYSPGRVLAALAGLELVRLDLIPDDAVSRGMVAGASLELAGAQEYGCGCFWLRRGIA